MNSGDLEKASLVENGFRKLTYSVDRFPFVDEVKNLLIGKGIVSRSVDLDKLHQYVPIEDQNVDEHHLNNIVGLFYETSSRFRQIYFDLIRYIGAEYFDFDFIFQEIPNFRFHFPVRFGEEFRNKDGEFIGHHTDTMLGHSFEEINFWLPLTKCFGSNALQVSNLACGIETIKQVLNDIDWNVDLYHTEGRRSYHQRLFSDLEFQAFVVKNTKPVALNLGDFIAFDTRCIHGPQENKEERTRVSIDFRIIPVHRYEQITKHYGSQGRSGRRFVRGDVFYEKSVREL